MMFKTMTAVSILTTLFLTHTALRQTAVFAFAHLPSSTTAISSPDGIRTIHEDKQTHSTLPHLSADQVRERVLSGRVYVHDDFLTEDQLRLLRRDMHQLNQQGKFIVNGLSDTRKGLKGEPSAAVDASRSNQGFNVKYDRSVCPIPWWQDSLLIDVDSLDEGECFNGQMGRDEEILHEVQVKLQRLRRDLAGILDRPTMLDSSLGHECYYSTSPPGSSLARHMDERHEESKGPRGWLLPSRRSLSWLIYLSEVDTNNNQDKDNGNDVINTNNQTWDAVKNGGMLRTFPQRHYRPNKQTGWEDTVSCGSHNGNLQIGWLIPTTETNESSTTHPVFLNCWYQHTNPYSGEPEPHNVLYIVRNPDNNKDQLEIEHITIPWLPDPSGNILEFLQHRAILESDPNSTATTRLFLKSHATQFHLLEDRTSWDAGQDPHGSIVQDILPKRGRLVVFDSVSLPHEVTEVFGGERCALAGWFHEETQALGG